MTREPRLRDFVAPSALDDARIERQWAALEREGLPRAGGFARGKRRGLSLAFGACVAAGAALAWFAMPRALAPRNGALVASAGREVSVKLEDGSQLELSERTELLFLRNEPNAIELSLRSGRARFDVTHRKARSFELEAGPCEVRVVGTRFVVERGARFVRIAVEEGVVEVRRTDQKAGELRRLAKGESLSIGLEARAPDPIAPRAADATPSAIQSATAAPAPATLANQPAVDDRKPSASTTHEHRGARDLRAATVPPEPALSAAELFARATLSRRAGRMRDAAVDYATLLARFPNDARAGLSAFELGRIRMDALADPEGAIEALSRAAAGAPHTSFHEDALARIVSANDALGRHDSCVRARERYLSSYPHGVHARTLVCR